MEEQVKILRAPLRISIAVLIVGVMFKIMHWPFGAWIIVFGFSLIAVLYPFRFMNKKSKVLLDYARLLFVICWAVYGIFAALHLPYKIIFDVLRSISFVFWIIMEGINYFSKVKEKKSGTINIISYIIIAISAALVLVGALFKIMHWPGAGPMLVVGLSLVVIWFLLDFFKIGKSKE